MLSIVTRNESSVVIEGHIPLAPEPVEHDQKARMLLVDSHPQEFDNRDVMPRLAPGAESVAEHEAQRGL